MLWFLNTDILIISYLDLYCCFNGKKIKEAIVAIPFREIDKKKPNKIRWNELFNWKVVSKQYRKLWANLKEKRENTEKSSNSRFFHPSIDYIFKEYPTEVYKGENLFVENGSINAEFLLFPLHTELVEIITTNKTKKIIELINKNKSISLKDLRMIGIEKNKANEVMALIEKLGIANNKSKEV